MRNAGISKVNKYVSSVLLMLSLCASSIAACICAHEATHQTPKSEHCHSSSAKIRQAENPHHPHEASVAENHHDETAEADNALSSINAGDCCCIKPAPKTAAKFENYKVESPAAVQPAEKSFEITRKWQVLTIKIVHRAAPFYLSASFYNISPGRAPPFFQA